jgi:hypothetical protein
LRKCVAYREIQIAEQGKKNKRFIGKKHKLAILSDDEEHWPK